MDAARLDRRVQFITTTPMQNNYGELVHQDNILATVSAQVTPIGGRETYLAAQIVPQARFKVVTRYRSDITTEHKLKFNETIFNIAHVAEIGRHDGLEILVTLP